MTTVYRPQMYCFRAGGEYKQPTMRVFSLDEHNEWTLWRSNSDHLYPKMIPEPDYSDSGDDAGSEDEEYPSYYRNSKPAAERLRDVTEVYVANADVTIKKPASSKTSSSKQVISAKKQASKTSPGIMPEKIKGNVSSNTLPKGPRRTRSKSPTKVSKPESTVLKTAKSQESTKKTLAKSASEQSSTSSIKRTKSPEIAKKAPAKVQTPTKAGDSKSKSTTARESPVGKKKVPGKTKSPTQAATPDKLKSSNAGTAPRTQTKPLAATTKREAGDVPKLSPLSSPSDETKSGVSSAVSTEHSSEDELIKPKKLYQLSTEKQMLHKELKFSQRYGKLAPSKTELQMAIERFTENKEKKELETGRNTSLENILAIQARKLKMQEDIDETPIWMDHLQKPPATLPNPLTDEFYRVHARVVNNNTLARCFLPDDDQSEDVSSQTVTHTESGSDS